MSEVSPISSRKSDHIRINLEEDVSSGLTTGFEKLHFVHQALPELDLDEIDPAVEIFGKRLKIPLLISSMTGGTSEAGVINRKLAAAAQFTGTAMGVGSQRAGLAHTELIDTFKIRSVAPNILLFANLGAVQLNYGYSIDECRQAVEMIEADGLILHLNALQEALQPEGNTRFADLLKKIETICRLLPVPVVVKEVGWGISGKCAKQLESAGVSAIDVAGAGGTSWSQVEMFRTKDKHRKNVVSAFRAWGIPTVDSIRQVLKAVPDMLVFASGGMKDGIDVAKSIALGASLGGMASLFLKAAVVSEKETIDTINEIGDELKVCMFACGVQDIQALKHTHLVRLNEIEE